MTTAIHNAPQPNAQSHTGFDVIIVGGGLAGLTAAIVLSRAGKDVLLLEKKSYPYQKVCGEYISNEVLLYIRSLGFDPFAFGATSINKLRVSTPAGKSVHCPLDLGGFGISRYTMDNALYGLAQKNGAHIMTNIRVTDVVFNTGSFTVTTNTGAAYTTKLVIGSYGKRDLLDKKMDRDFLKHHTGYLGVKYHVKTDYPADEIGLDNFSGGYCGISKVEDETYNLCYLYHRPGIKNYATIPELEETILFKNPVLKSIFKSSDFLFAHPEVINEISFEPKKLVEQHVLMCGDSAGLITPLCGNGMSMAIATAKMLSELILGTGILDTLYISPAARQQLEVAYQSAWNHTFKKRLFWGRTIQRSFGNPTFTGLFVNTVHALPPLERKLLSLTHGRPLPV